MKHTKFLIPITLLSLVSITGCGLSSATNSNTNATASVNTTNTAKTNKNVAAVTNTTNANTNTNTADVDTSDWLTYTNEEYGFSYRYPGDWTLNTNDAGVTSIESPVDSTKALLKAKIFVEQKVVKSEMTTEEALKYEDGREPLPLQDEKITTINSLPTYRAFRQLKKDELIYTTNELSDKTYSAVEYTYLNGKDLIRLWFTIEGENYKSQIQLIDAVASTFSI